MPHSVFHKLPILLFFSFAQILLYAQEEAMHFSHLSRENGLPSNRTRCVMQDFQGYIWIGTDNGLVRFDGRNTTVFRPDRNDTSSVIDLCINALYETHDSLMLIGALDGLSIFNPSSNSFRIGISRSGSAKRSMALNAMILAACNIPLCPIDIPAEAVAPHVCKDALVGKQAVMSKLRGVLQLRSPTSVEKDIHLPSSMAGKLSETRAFPRNISGGIQ